MTIQYIIVFVIIAAAVAYAIWKIRYTAIHTDSLCSGCPGCELRNKARRCRSKEEIMKRLEKKEGEKFGRTK